MFHRRFSKLWTVVTQREESAAGGSNWHEVEPVNAEWEAPALRLPWCHFDRVALRYHHHRDPDVVAPSGNGSRLPAGQGDAGGNGGAANRSSASERSPAFLRGTSRLPI